MCYGRTTMLSNQAKNHHRSGRYTTIKMSYTREKTRHRHPTTGPSVRFPQTNNLSSDVCATRDASQSVDQAGLRPGYSTTDQLYTFQHSDRGLPSGTNHFALQPLTAKGRSTRLSTAAYVGLGEIKALKNHPHSSSHGFTTQTEWQRTPTSEASSSPPSGRTRSTLSFNSFLQHIMDRRSLLLLCFEHD